MNAVCLQENEWDLVLNGGICEDEDREQWRNITTQVPGGERTATQNVALTFVRYGAITMFSIRAVPPTVEILLLCK